ncbi:restriction endonuclease subunit S [Streptomyces cadmiisoli]|uniref:restriction endonuclease subunit S n=1 Tax=Streptomyces cadmiisoli TaxID=2184053 RepID=UPI00364D1B2E
MTDSRIVRFKELLSEPLRNGVSYPAKLRGVGIPMVNMGEAFAYDVIRDQKCELAPLTDSERERFLLEDGDLLFVRQSLTYAGAGRCVLVGRGTGPRTWESHLIRARINTDIADPRFIYYYFRSPGGRRNVETIVNQVAAAGIKGSDLKELEIPCPTLVDQQRVSSLLGALDDKIEVNERIAATALNLAEAMYIRASASSIWRSVKLRDAARWLSGGTPKTSEPSYWGGTIPWISALSLKSPWIGRSDRNVTELGAASGTRLVPADTVLFVVRGSSLKEEFRIGITQREVTFGQDCKALIAHGSIDPHALFHGIRSQTKSVLEMVDETSIGAGRLSTDLISALEIRVPSDPRDPAVAQVRNLDRLAATRQQESQSLATLRDTLIPQLMSGRLRVKDAEKIVEDHT